MAPFFLDAFITKTDNLLEIYAKCEGHVNEDMLEKNFVFELKHCRGTLYMWNYFWKPIVQVVRDHQICGLISERER